MDLTPEYLDPEWTCFVRCPHCHVRTFACCAEHANDGMSEHIEESH